MYFDQSIFMDKKLNEYKETKKKIDMIKTVNVLMSQMSVTAGMLTQPTHCRAHTVCSS